jgi:hypothetical protein
MEHLMFPDESKLSAYITWRRLWLARDIINAVVQKR